MIIEVASTVLAQSNLGVPGKSLFVYSAPDNVRNCILVIGSLDGVERDEYLPGYKKAVFNVIVRSTDYQSAMTIAKQVVAALDLHRLVVNGLDVIRMRATRDPIAFPIPDSDVIEVSVNLWAAYIEP